MAINILIVDDSSVMRTMIVKTLRMSGLALGEVHQAADGRKGLEALRANWVDLVLADINMPVMTGEQMIDAMRRDPALEALPVVVISTESSATRIDQLRAKGVDFIHKPFTPETIRDVVTRTLGLGGCDGSSCE